MPPDTLGEEIQLRAKQLASKQPAAGAYFAEALLHCPQARLAIGTGGYALILSPAEPISAPDILLGNLAVHFSQRCKITANGKSSTETVVLVATKNPDPQVQAAFLNLVELILPAAKKISAQAIKTMLLDLVELFRALSHSRRKTAQGLWGELFVISEAPDANTAAESWHATPMDRHDFSLRGSRAEIKTVMGPRQHHFGYEQLFEPHGISVMVGSIITQELSGGTSVGLMLKKASAKIRDTALRARIIKVAIASIGNQWHAAALLELDERMARQSLRWFAAGCVPCVAPPPPGVYEIRFRSDLQLAPAMSKTETRAFSELGAALA